MKERLVRLAERIRDEFVDLARVVERAQEGWRRAQRRADDFYLDSVALNLHGFYAGLERLFQLVAASVDTSVPQGANWHQVLLEQMAIEVPKVRPAVLSEDTCRALDEYRGFRHIVRHVYTFKFDPVRVQKLIERVPGLFLQVRAELLAFADFLEQSAYLDEVDDNNGQQGEGRRVGES